MEFLSRAWITASVNEDTKKLEPNFIACGNRKQYTSLGKLAY